MMPNSMRFFFHRKAKHECFHNFHGDKLIFKIILFSLVIKDNDSISNGNIIPNDQMYLFLLIKAYNVPEIKLQIIFRKEISKCRPYWIMQSSIPIQFIHSIYVISSRYAKQLRFTNEMQVFRIMYRLPFS